MNRCSAQLTVDESHEYTSGLVRAQLTQENSSETNIPAQQKETESQVRISCSNENEEWPKGDQAAPSEGPAQTQRGQ